MVDREIRSVKTKELERKSKGVREGRNGSQSEEDGDGCRIED